MARSASQKKRRKDEVAGTGKKHLGRKGRGAGSDTHNKGGWSTPQQTFGGRTGRDVGFM